MALPRSTGVLERFPRLNVIDPSFDPTAFSHNKERLLRHEVARQFFDQVIEEARRPARSSASKRSSVSLTTS